MEGAALQFVYSLKHLSALRRKHENLGKDGPNPSEHTADLPST